MPSFRMPPLSSTSELPDTVLPLTVSTPYAKLKMAPLLIADLPLQPGDFVPVLHDRLPRGSGLGLDLAAGKPANLLF